MRKLIAGCVAVAALSTTAIADARAPIARVDDPTPNGAFTGSYDCSYHRYDAQGNATKVERRCTQKGYVAVYADGVTACQGSDAYKRPDNGEVVQGYAWVGASHAAKSKSGAAPGDHAGAGHNRTADDPSTRDKYEGQGPCEDPPPPPPGE
jgi:opacity protein-like surface antigen